MYNVLLSSPPEHSTVGRGLAAGDGTGMGLLEEGGVLGGCEGVHSCPVGVSVEMVWVVRIIWMAWMVV